MTPARKKEILQELRDLGGYVFEVEDHVIKNLYPPKPVRPSKPRLHPDSASYAVSIYAKELEQYEKELPIYEEKNRIRNEHISELNEILIEYIKEEANLSKVPEKYRDKVWAFAWNKGESYADVYSHLDELVNIFI